MLVLNGDITKMTKRKFVWMLQNEKNRVSSDVNHRFIARQSIRFTPLMNDDNVFWKHNIITKGHYILVKNNTDVIYGLVINFKKSNQTTKSGKRYIKDYVDRTSKNVSDIEMLLEPAFYVQNGKKVPVMMQNFYVKITNYLSHASQDVDFSSINAQRYITNELDEN